MIDTVELSPDKSYFINKNDNIIEFDLATKNKYEMLNPKMIQYLGCGIICMIKGNVTEDTWEKDYLYFYKRL